MIIDRYSLALSQDKNGDGFIDRNEFRVFLATEKASTFL